MKKVLHLMLCVFIGTHSYQQITASGNSITPQVADQNLASTLIGVPVNSAVTDSSSCNGKKLYPKKGDGDNGIYLNGNSYSYNAGDTIVLTAGQNPYSYVTLEYFTKGTDA